MSTKKVCNFEKYGYCKKKEECNDHHPKEVCKKRSCKVSKCLYRHPKPCKFFESGNCRFKEACKYDHTKNVNELNERIIKLENQVLGLRNLNEQQADAILFLNERLSHLEIKCRKSSEESEDKIKSSQVTSVNDDSSRKRKSMEKSKDRNPANENLRKEIEFSVDVQTKIKELVVDIGDKSCQEAKEILKNFQEHINQKIERSKFSFSGTKKDAFIKLTDNFNTDCNYILVRSFQTFSFRYCIEQILKDFQDELIKLRSLKLKN